jgi:hypothetical protein
VSVSTLDVPVAVAVAFLSDKAAVPSDTIKESPSLLIYSSAIQSRKKQKKVKLSLGVNKHCPVKKCERMEVHLHIFIAPHEMKVKGKLFSLPALISEKVTLLHQGRCVGP